IRSFPKDFVSKDARRTALKALWWEVTEGREWRSGPAWKIVTKQQIESTLGLRIAPITRHSYGYGSEQCDPFAFGMELERCANDARWVISGERGSGLCNTHAEMYVRRRTKVPRTQRWTDMAGKAGLVMLRKSREEWSGGSRRNRDR